MSLSAVPPRLSVVIAAQNARSTIGRCLESIEAQRGSGIRQIILVDNSTDGTADFVRQGFPTVEVVERTGDALVPELWGHGILMSREEIVALTTGNMAPEAGWAAAVLDAYTRDEWAGVGGVVLPAAGLDALAAAVYWLRYHRYAGRPPASVVRDIPGDNGSYRRSHLTPYTDRIRREGFWEYEINQDLTASGARLFNTPDAAVRYLGGESFVDFARQRLVHGRRFGANRIARLRGVRRWLLVASWPLTPVAFLARIVREASRAGGAASLLRASPPLVCLLMCWSVGELSGYLMGPAPASAKAVRPERQLAERG